MIFLIALALVGQQVSSLEELGLQEIELLKTENVRSERSEESSRSIKSSLDNVLREVKNKLEDIFSVPNVELTQESRLIKSSVENAVPEKWFAQVL